MEGKASRVLHIRGIPMDATEGEVIQLGLPFGRMTNLVMARKKNQVGGNDHNEPVSLLTAVAIAIARGSPCGEASSQHIPVSLRIHL